MGIPAQPTENEIVEAIERAREVIEAVTNDEESWFDRLLMGKMIDLVDRHAIFVMMQELVRARPLVLCARAEPRINESCSKTLSKAVDDYENV